MSWNFSVFFFSACVCVWLNDKYNSKHENTKRMWFCKLLVNDNSGKICEDLSGKNYIWKWFLCERDGGNQFVKYVRMNRVIWREL